MHENANQMGFFLICRLLSTVKESNICGSLALNIKNMFQLLWNTKTPIYIPKCGRVVLPWLRTILWTQADRQVAESFPFWGQSHLMPALLVTVLYLCPALFSQRALPTIRDGLGKKPPSSFLQLRMLGLTSAWSWSTVFESLTLTNGSTGSQRKKKINFGYCSNCKEQTCTIPSTWYITLHFQVLF